MRRTFRRHIRKTLAHEVPPILQEANFAFSKGEYGRAGELFERIAEGADARGGPRAPLFLLQAGRSRLFAGQTKLAMPSLKRGLELLAERQQYQRLQDAGQRVIAELTTRGLSSEVTDIEILLKTHLPAKFTIEPQATSTKKPILPTHCPSCGAAVSSPLAKVGMQLRASFSFPSNWFPINSAIVSALHSLNFGPPSVAY